MLEAGQLCVHMFMERDECDRLYEINHIRTADFVSAVVTWFISYTSITSISFTEKYEHIIDQPPEWSVAS